LDQLGVGESDLRQQSGGEGEGDDREPDRPAQE
jgi:hypothetical protein